MLMEIELVTKGHYSRDIEKGLTLSQYFHARRQMDQGEIVEQGSYEELYANPNSFLREMKKEK